MKRLMTWLDRFDYHVLLLLLAALVAVVFLQVASRFVLKLPIEWSEEMARFLFIWFCWLGCSFATCSYHHIRITAQFRIMPRVVALWMLRAGDVLWIAFNLVVLYGGILYLDSILQYPYRAMITEINMFWIFMPIPLIFLVFTLRVAFNLFDPRYFEMTMSEAEREAAEEVEIGSPDGRQS